MYTPPNRQALDTLQGLRSQLERLTQLAEKYPELTAEQQQLEDSIVSVQALLSHYNELEQDWEWFFENSLDMKCIVTLDGYFIRVNPAICRLLGYSAEELKSRPLYEFMHPEDIDKTKGEIEKLANGKQTFHFENRYRDKQGKYHWISWCCPPFTADSRRLYAIARDITEAKKTQEELLFQAMHDPLTGLRNRASLDFDLQQAIIRCDAHPSMSMLVILIDLNDFKIINDIHGHAVGDRVLIEVANRFGAIKRKKDLIFRIGGDEFVWVAEGVTSSLKSNITKRIAKELNKPLAHGEHQLNISGSIGVAAYPEDATTPLHLLEQADRAMYQIKKALQREKKINKTDREK